MSEFIGTIVLVGLIGIGAYMAGRNSRAAEIRYWAQRTRRAEKIADEMGMAAIENYIDLAIADLRAGA